MKLKIQKSLRQGIFTEQVTAFNSNTKTTQKATRYQMIGAKKKKINFDRPTGYILSLATGRSESIATTKKPQGKKMGMATTIHIQR